MTQIEASGLQYGHGIIERYRISEADPLSAHGEILHKAVLRREDWQIRVETDLRLSASKTRFAYQDDECVFSRSWDRSVPRKLV